MKTLLYAVAILLIPSAPYLASVLQLSTFYRDYGIQIEYWATPSEMQALCISYFLVYIKEILILLLFSSALIIFNDLVKKSIGSAKGPHEIKRLRRILFVTKIFGVTTMLYLAFFEGSRILGEWISALLLSILVVGYLSITFKDHDGLPFSTEQKIMGYSIALSLSLLMVHSGLLAILKKDLVATDNRRVTVQTNTQTIDSVKFLGKTSQAYFFAKRIHKMKVDSFRTYIIKTENVRSVRFENGKWSTIIY